MVEVRNWTEAGQDLNSRTLPKDIAKISERSNSQSETAKLLFYKLLQVFLDASLTTEKQPNTDRASSSPPSL